LSNNACAIAATREILLPTMQARTMLDGNHEAASSHGGGCRTGKNQFYIPVDEARHMWEMGTAVLWSDINLRIDWYLNARRLLVPPMLREGRARRSEIRHQQAFLVPNLRSDPAFASDAICAK
jgi:hypothetical protein